MERLLLRLRRQCQTALLVFLLLLLQGVRVAMEMRSEVILMRGSELVDGRLGRKSERAGEVVDECIGQVDARRRRTPERLRLGLLWLPW